MIAMADRWEGHKHKMRMLFLEEGNMLHSMIAKMKDAEGFSARFAMVFFCIEFN